MSDHQETDYKLKDLKAAHRARDAKRSSAEAPSEPRAQSARSSVAAGSGWVRIEDGLPQHMERVLATYVGVYGHRLVTYWWDGHRGRFGLPTEADERGPQPATHWHRLPPLPNAPVRHEPKPAEFKP